LHGLRTCHIFQNKKNFFFRKEAAMGDAYDFIVVGGGIGGASVAYWLSRHARVLLLEREDQPGYHSTGRSAALYMASYGPPQVRAMTVASRSFFDAPPAGFSDHPLLTRRGALTFAHEDSIASLDEHERLVRSVSADVARMDAADTLRMVPVLRPHGLAGGVYEADAADIDVHALLQGFLRGMRANGGMVACGAALMSLRRQAGVWTAETSSGIHRAPVIVNAAGAWADAVGALADAPPIGLEPKRRSALLFEPPQHVDSAAWPMVMDVDHTFYVKPDAGMLLGSPFNADPVAPHDVQAEELDIAIAIDAIERMTTMAIRRPRHVWAGLRSFVADGELVGGYDPLVPGLFWAAAQGGYGIQTAPAAGELYAALALGVHPPDAIVRHGVDPAAISPARLPRA
jgi:D-arginine dehydrogenase